MFLQRRYAPFIQSEPPPDMRIYIHFWLQELEASNHRLEAEVRRLSDNSATSQASQDSLVTRMEEQDRGNKAAARKHDEEVCCHTKSCFA